MAAADGEADPGVAAAREHLSSCTSCQAWHANWQSLTARIGGLSYEATDVDLWPAVKDRLQPSAQTPPLAHQLWPIAVALLVWRALQLFIDLPMPVLHPLVPLAAAVVAAWRVGRVLLTIETSAPELQKRGI
jgi:anti-sigma factor RsiW